MCGVSLDIKNAFNSIGWDHVMASLLRWDVPGYLQRIFQSYFSERIAEIEGPGGKIIRFSVTCGVPQGSVVGPVLWNMAYDAVLRLSVPRDVKIIGFADDTLIVASGKTSEGVETKLNDALFLVVGEIKNIGLTIAVQKTEAIMFRRRYKDHIPNIGVEGSPIKMSKQMKYLGIIVDENLNFKEHITNAARRAQEVTNRLARLMPNIGGPRELRRKLLVSVVHFS